VESNLVQFYQPDTINQGRRYIKNGTCKESFNLSGHMGRIMGIFRTPLILKNRGAEEFNERLWLDL
jgi:hypothetical protein